MNTSLLMRHKGQGMIAAAILLSCAIPAKAADSHEIVSASLLIDKHESRPALNNRINIPCMLKKGRGQARVIAKEPAIVINSSVKTEVVVNENFSKWTKGTPANPNPDMVTDEEASSLMNYPGEWTLFRMHEAGGNGFMGFDEVGDDGPGYIMSPGIDVMSGDNGYYRFTCRVKNVNANAQDQVLQAFFMDGNESSILSASSQPMQYNEWTVCEWIGRGCSATQFMVFGWKGNVLIDEYKVEKLTFPLDTPTGVEAVYHKDGNIALNWNKVDNATSYSVRVESGFETIFTAEVGDVSTCPCDINFESGESYAFYVMARNGEETSYWGHCNSNDMQPESIGAAVALDPTDICESGFTAHWEKADYANKYLLMPVLTHTATESGEEFFILNDTFANVPETADSYNPIMISPLLGYTGTDIYMSRAGWTIDMGIFMRMTPDMPALVLTNQYAEYGLPGSLTSPATDFSVGNGTVKVSGMGLSALDDVALVCGFVNADGEMYSSKDFEVTTDGDMFEIELTGGQADSRLVIRITDSADGGDMVLIPMLSVSTVLNEGESITVPVETIHAGNVDNAGVEAVIDENNKYSYTVQGYFSALLMGEISNSVEVSGMQNAVETIKSNPRGKAYVDGGAIRIENPAAEKCDIYSFDGRLIFSTTEASATVNADKGGYIIRIGDNAIKVVY